MPNHCNNTLTVDGSKARIRDFARDHYKMQENWDGEPAGKLGSKTLLDFSYAVPYPPLHERLDLSQGWYDWQCNNWGTKWNAYDITPETFPQVLDEIELRESLTYSFDTAWAPPVSWLLQAAEKYPNLTFTLTYEESGMGFAGYHKMKDGKVYDEKYLDDFHKELLDPKERKLLESEDTWEEGWEIVRVKLDKFFQEIPD